MTLQELLEQFNLLHLDERPEWGKDLNANLAINAINLAIREVLKKIAIDNTTRKIISTETEILLDDGKADLPSDFMQLVKIETIEGEEVDFYKIKLVDGIYKIETIIIPRIKIVYIKKPQVLENLDDELKLPTEFQNDVLNFALVEYFRNQRDWGNVGNALQYAEGKILENIQNFWME